MKLNEIKGRVLLVEDSLEQALILRSWIENDLEFGVVHVTDGSAARQFARFGEWDLVVSDIELPGVLGIDLLKVFKEHNPWTPVLLMTAHEKVEYAVEALRNNADDFLMKPIERQVFLEKAREVMSKALENRQQNVETVLAIGAHPDDVEIGCGGALARHASKGDEVAILTMSGGEHGGSTSERVKESRKAASLIGAELVMGDLMDTAIGEGRETIKLIEDAIGRFKPTIVYTHTANDGHQDHRNVHRATLVAARGVPNVYCYQAPSTTVEFKPNLFVDISRFVDQKLKLISAYQSQTLVRSYLEEDLIRSTARYWGRFAGYSMVEPLEVVRQRG